MVWQRVCILGVGLLGGSIGLRLKQARLASEVVGFGRNRYKLDMAVSLDAIDRGFENIESASHDADLVIACTPVQQIPETIRAAALIAKPGAFFTDVGSTKSRIVESLVGSSIEANFVGSHPMAGSDRSGVEFSSSHLFERRLVILTPSASTPKNTIETISQFWQSLGASVEIMGAEKHDEAMAIVSHLPHVIASMLSGATPRELLELTGQGWSDTTRIAAGHPILWRQIIQENREHVLRALKNFATISQTWVMAIEAGDFDRVEQLLNAGKDIRDSVGNRHPSG